MLYYENVVLGFVPKVTLRSACTGIQSDQYVCLYKQSVDLEESIFDT